MARNKIAVRGVIVGPENDGDWAQSYIERGLFTPESHIRAKVAAAKDIDLYINSQGGYVFEANEMINAFNAHIAAGNDLEITIGSLAASAAASMVLMIKASRISAHRNTQIMFHSAASFAVGGPDAMRDTAEILANMNNSVIDALAAKTGKPASEFKAWFAEGREKWLTAKQAKELGLIDHILDSEAEPIEAVSAEAATALETRNLKIAAFGVPVPPSEDPIAAMKADFEARIAGLQSAKDKEICALRVSVDDLTAELGAAKADLITRAEAVAKIEAENKALSEQVSGLTTQTAKLQQDLAASGEQLARAQTSIKQLGAGALSHGEAVASFKDAVSKLGYVEARKQHPDQFAAYMAANVPVQKKKG